MKVARLPAVATLVFAASAAVTIAWCGSMSAMPGMEMPGGWRMSMAWMRMPGQGWLEQAGLFLAMWAVMMLAMMLPAFTPVLARYRRAVPASSAALLACVSAGYFGIWILLGAALFPLGLCFAELVMQVPAISECVPRATALVVLAAGASQFTAWKARRLACCRHSVDCCRDTQPTYRAAWRHGLKIGLRCVHCCACLTAVLLVLGVMDLPAMASLTLATTTERLVPGGENGEGGESAARVVGVVLMMYGGILLCRSLA